MPITEKTITVDCVLFDMDGTLIDSTPAVNATWKFFCEKYDLDYDTVLESCHGYRTVENLRRFIPSLSDDELPKEVIAFESKIASIAAEATKSGKEGAITALPGAKSLLAQIAGDDPEQQERRRKSWAIVTSATKAYAHPAFASTNLVPVLPSVFITSDVCTAGKPDPQPYLLGAKASNQLPLNCLVVEDAPAGVRAGKASGARVLGLKTTHDGQKQWENGADFLVQDLSHVSAKWVSKEGGGEELRITIQSEEKPEGI